VTFRSGQTVSGVSLSGPVTGTVLRVRPSIIDRSVLIVDLDVDGVEHNVPAEDCTLAESPIYMPDGRTQTRFVRVCRDAAGKYAVVD